MAAAAIKFKPFDTVYNGDRWRVPGQKDVYQALYRTVNGVPFWELYHAPTPKSAPVYVFGGLEDFFGAKLKCFYNANALKKVRTPKKDRVGSRLLLWGLTH